MKNGICLLCFGDESFGHLTYNLAASIKQYSNTSITVFTDYESLNSIDTSIFDNTKEIPNDVLYIKNKSHPNRFKLCLYDLSPYENTMYLDVDSLYMKNKPLDEIFELINEKIDIIAQNEKIIDLNITDKVFHGFNVKTFKPSFNYINNKLYQMHGQFLLFKKNEKTKKFFEISKQIYDQIENGTLTNIDKWFWFGRPIEELTMTIATGLTNINILENFAPVSVQNDNLEYEEIINKKYFISICGSSTQEIALKNGGYCQNENLTKKYINHYNKKIKYLKNINCTQYIEKIYKI
jgi:hypothetical protein